MHIYVHLYARDYVHRHTYTHTYICIHTYIACMHSACTHMYIIYVCVCAA